MHNSTLVNSMHNNNKCVSISKQLPYLLKKRTFENVTIHFTTLDDVSRIHKLKYSSIRYDSMSLRSGPSDAEW